MYIAINERPRGGMEIINIMPVQLRKYMYRIDIEKAQELRMIVGKPLAIRYPDGFYYITSRAVLTKTENNAVIINDGHIAELMERITQSSLYSAKDEIKNGYVTIDGGHRIGLAGTAVTDNGSIEFIKNISAVNIRFAREVVGAADTLIKEMGGIKSVLVVSSPCCGKTTILRDIARIMANKGYSVAIADERREIAAMHNGRSSFDLGSITAVLDNCPKHEAMLMLLRSMSPDIIITDEIGTLKDIEAIRTVMNSGVFVAASVHGRDIKQLMKRRHISRLVPMFDTVVVLSRRNGVGTIEEIINNA